MKKILLSLVALMATMSSFAALKTVEFNMADPASMGITGTGANIQVGSNSLVVGDISIKVVTDASSALQKVRFNGGTLKFGVGCALSIETAVGNIRSIKIDGDVCGDADITFDKGAYKSATWTGVEPKVVFTQATAANTVRKITVTYQVPNPVDPRPLGEVESYVSVKAIQGDPQLGEDGNPKLDGYGNPVYGFTYEFAPEFANPVKTEGALTVEYGTTHVKAASVAGATAKTCDESGVTEWNDMKFDLKNHLNDNTSALHKGIALGTGNPVFGYEIEAVWKDGAPTGDYRQCFNLQNPDYDPKAAYEASQKGEKYDIPQYLEEKYYYWKPGCGEMPGQGLYHKYTADCDGQLKVFVWVNKGNRNTYVVDEETMEPVTFEVEGYMNNQTENIPDPLDPEKTVAVKKFLSPLDVEALNDPAKPYVIAGTQAGSQVFWGNIIYNIKKDQTIWIFQESSQIGVGGFEFRPYGSATGIENVAAEKVAAKTATRTMVKNGKLVIVNGASEFNVAGQRMK